MAVETDPPVRVAALILFFGYVSLLVVAGAWGIVGARLDLPLLLQVRLGELPPDAEANLLSQYRFLRAIEFGFGVFAWRFHKEIFTQRTFTQIFLTVMAAGVVARLISLPLDGRPSAVMFIFLGWEALGVIIIAAYTGGLRRQEVAQ